MASVEINPQNAAEMAAIRDRIRNARTSEERREAKLDLVYWGRPRPPNHQTGTSDSVERVSALRDEWDREAD